MKHVSGLISRAMAFAAFALMAAGAASAAVIERVSCENQTPDVKVSEELFRSSIVSAAGAEYSPRTVSEDVKRLMKTGFFKNVVPEAVPGAEGRVVLVFKLTPQDTVREVRVEGNKQVKTKKIAAKIALSAGAPLNEQRMSEDVSAIRKLYDDAGYYQATIRAELRPVDMRTHTVDVVYVVGEAPRYKLHDISFAGNKAFPDSLLRKQLRTAPGFWGRLWSRLFSTGFLNGEALKMDEESLADFYTARGYLDFRIADAKETVSANGKWVSVRLMLDEGQPYKVVPAENAASTVVEIVGNKRFTKEQLLAAPDKNWTTVPAFKAGETFNSNREQAVMDLIRAHYDPLGYVDLRIVPRHKIDSALHTVAVTFEISEGVPCTIRDVEISGNVTTQDRVIRRELYYPPLIPDNDTADAGKIRMIKPRLMNLDYFESVDVTPVATEREGEKDLDIRVVEKKTGSFQIGAGVSSNDGVVGMLTLAQSNFDLFNWRNGFTGAGQHLLLQMRMGTQMSDFSVNFTEPWFRDRPLRMDLDLHRRERDQRYYTQTMTGAGVTFTRPLLEYPAEGSEWRNWRQSYGYRYDYAQLSKFDNSTDAFLKDEKGGYSVSAVTYAIKRDTRDSYKYPTQGSLLQLSADYEPSFLGSYSDVYHLDVQGTKYIPLRRWVLKLDAEAGTVDNLSGRSPALFDRLFAGGYGSIRGFKRRDVGPVDSHDNAAGGGSLMRGTVEFIHPIYTDMVRGSIWCDFGNVWTDSYSWKPDNLNASVGVGLQIELPGGIPVRLDYGFPVITREPHLGKSGRFDFSLGFMF